MKAKFAARSQPWSRSIRPSGSRAAPETAKPLEELAPFTEAYPIPETGVRYYLCRNGACARPVDSISEVRRLLEQN